MLRLRERQARIGHKLRSLELRRGGLPIVAAVPRSTSPTTACCKQGMSGSESGEQHRSHNGTTLMSLGLEMLVLTHPWPLSVGLLASATMSAPQVAVLREGAPACPRQSFCSPGGLPEPHCEKPFYNNILLSTGTVADRAHTAMLRESMKFIFYALEFWPSS